MSQPIVVFAGNMAGEHLIPSGYAAARYADRAGYVARLADEHAALILVSGDDPGWRFWTTTPKTSPATRRIPIIVVTADPVVRVGALLSGANLVLAPDELAAQLPDVLADLARVPDPSLLAALDAECAEPLPAEGEQAIADFNAGAFYKQHDLFEALWVEETRPVRDLYRAVLQVGIAYYQVTRRNHRGALKMLLRSIQWLALLPDTCQGIDVAQLRADAARVRAELERVGENGIESFDLSLLKPVRRVDR